MATIIKGIANRDNLNINCVMMQHNTQNLMNEPVTVYVLYINGKPHDHAVNLGLVDSWYSRESAKIENPAEVVEVGRFATGQIYVREIR